MVELSIYKFEGSVFVAAAGQTVENWKTARAFEWFPVYYYFFFCIGFIQFVRLQFNFIRIKMLN